MDNSKDIVTVNKVHAFLTNSAGSRYIAIIVMKHHVFCCRVSAVVNREIYKKYNLE